MFELAAHTQRAHAHAVFRHGVGRVVLEPFCRHIQGRGKVEDVRVVALFEERQAQLGQQKRTACIDLIHQIINLT